MTSAPTRHFASRLPFSNSDDSDEASNPSSPSRPRRQPPSTATEAPLPRRRFKARVVTTAAPSQRRGTDERFLPISSSALNTSEAPSSPPVSASPSNSHSAHPSSSDSSSDSSSSSSESGSSSPPPSPSGASPLALPPSHPVFRPASQRSPPPPSSGRADDPAHDEARDKARRHEARRLLALALAEDDRRLDDAEPQLPDDTDHQHDHDADFALWRLRELLRIRRDRDEQIAWDKRRTASRQQREPA